VYLPILFLQGMEGRMFRPMAMTVCTALLGSLVLALTMIPMLVSFSFRKGLPPRAAKKRLGSIGEAVEQRWLEKLNNTYIRCLEWAMDHRALTMGLAAVVLVAALGSLYFIGTEFMPQLDEGSILIETRKLPGVSLTDSIEISKRIV